MRRHGLRDDQWARIRDLLPGRVGHVGVTAKDNRLFVEAVLYRYRTGIPWRDLPERFGCGVKVQTRFSRWAKAGVWERVFQHLAADADNEYAMIDSTIVRAHQHAAGVLSGLAPLPLADGTWSGIGPPLIKRGGRGCGAWNVGRRGVRIRSDTVGEITIRRQKPL